jgi:C-terminal processing protease CtpA/Prc
VQPDSPAAAAGVQAGDIITEIDGRPATGFTRDEINRMFEQDGRPCRLRLKRGAHTFKVTFRIRVPL